MRAMSGLGGFVHSHSGVGYLGGHHIIPMHPMTHAFNITSLAQSLAATPFAANVDNPVDALMGQLYPAMLTAHRCVARRSVKLRADLSGWFSWFEQRHAWEMLAMPNRTLAWDATRACVVLASWPRWSPCSAPWKWW